MGYRMIDNQIMSCMRCGTCLSVCPTWKETFRENASPRGRVALIRKVLKGRVGPSRRVMEYLDLCLGCQACASACPSGVNPGEVVSSFRCSMKEGRGLSLGERLILRHLLPHPDRLERSITPLRWYQQSRLQRVFRSGRLRTIIPERLYRMERLLPPLPPTPLRHSIDEITLPDGSPRGTVGFFLGCVMSILFPEASRATIRILTLLGYRVITPKKQICCGAPAMLASDRTGLRNAARHTCDLFNGFSPDLIVTDCAGCGAELKRYGETLEGEEGAVRFSEKVRDISELLSLHADELSHHLHPLRIRATYHDPCHLAHCQGVRSEPRRLIRLIPGIDFRELADADACCGSAGTYGIRHPAMADPITSRKIDTIRESGAEVVVTGNPGCLLQIRDGLSPLSPPIRVMHLTELLWMSIQGSG